MACCHETGIDERLCICTSAFHYRGAELTDAPKPPVADSAGGPIPGDSPFVCAGKTERGVGLPPKVGPDAARFLAPSHSTPIALRGH